MKKTRICVVGLGYIGLPMAVFLSNKNYEVLGVDINQEVIQNLKKGIVHFEEPFLNEYLDQALKSGKLNFSTKPNTSDIFIICVPTPIKKVRSKIVSELKFVKSAIASIIDHIKSGNSIIIESTSPIGTTENMYKLIKKLKDNKININMAYCPERVLPGSTFKEFEKNDRIVGGIDKRSSKIISSFYKTFVKAKVFSTDSKTAEMCKLAENSFRDANIAFANELSLICEKNGVNVWELINLANKHPRVNILNPGIGVGGHCIAVDPWFLISQNTQDTKFIHQARKTNDNKTNWIKEDLINAIVCFKNDKLKEPNILCLGLAFKPDIDDLRGSPAINIIDFLHNNTKSNIEVCEPNIKTNDKYNLVDLKEGLNKADIVIGLVKHKEFLKLENTVLKNKNIIFKNYCGI